MKAAALLLLLVPAVFAGSWSIKQDNFATIATAVGCATAQTCVVPVGINGQGSFVWVSQDGCNTFNPAPAPGELMYLGAAAQGPSAVVADELSIIAAPTEPYNFSTRDPFVTSQNVEVSADGAFYGAAGQNMNGDNGAAISTNGGISWTYSNASCLKTESRYGAYPSATTWYISAGEWPDNHNPPTDSTSTMLTARIHIEKQGVNMKPRLFKGVTSDVKDGNGWKAQIVKTTDGGKTWTSVFYDEGNFYFNQIGCGSVNHCCAVGEADASNTPGIRIYCTWDGGNTWTRTLWQSSQTMSIMALDFLTDNEAWAAGGNMDALNFQGYFWHTLDGGKTWSPQTVPGVYGNDLSFPTGKVGFATAFNAADQSTLLSYQ